MNPPRENGQVHVVLRGKADFCPFTFRFESERQLAEQFRAMAAEILHRHHDSH